ncbi:hypothetical protein [Puniceicoccus vermicola]|uniref:STAS/SEC14 domain-containing protein n=1 Tax=Puniceicoccus vermicola TaxID=388746 RepID=A0A7X1B1E1_9BACT|nr:hypothetical protein [Puniceicoccus vermicola]MBC2603767.1 hypothetical protein [Puniceicoccus vermicola]
MKNYSFQWDHRKLTITFRGVLTFEDVVNLCNERIADERYDSLRYILNDFTNLEGVIGSEVQVKNAFIYVNQSQRFGRRDKMLLGYVLGSPEVRAKLEEFLRHANEKDHSWERRVFDTIEESDAWAEDRLKEW